jgi:hypothetical protein
MRLSRFRVSSLCLFALVGALLGCGARTPLTDGTEDGSVPGRDASSDGGGRDGGPGRDAGPGSDLGPIGCRSDAECDDGRGCNGPERCERGACTFGIPMRCDDLVDCTDDVCVERAGGRAECISTPTVGRCPEGTLCSATGCATVECMGGDVCDDGIACNGVEICGFGMCLPGEPERCDDGNACTSDVCVEGEGCVATPRDDDRDGALNAACGGDDCDDSNPAIRPGAPELCDDRRDNDCNGAADCRDATCSSNPVCAGPPPPPPPPPPPGDGGAATREIGIAACTNMVDDDGDGRRDCSDNDCRGFGPMGECCNGVDDTPGDMDPNFDLFACRCFSDADCAGVGSIETSCWTRSFSLCAPRCNFVGGNRFCREFFAGSLEVCDAATGECIEG